MNSLYENKNSWAKDTRPVSSHVVCDSCQANWMGYLIHEATCPKV